MSLPTNPDLGPQRSPRGSVRALHFQPRAIALVLAGGCAGTLARELAVAPASTIEGSAYLTWGVNVSGALLLSVLMAILVFLGPDDGPRRTARLLLGTGFLGGFTTYSAHAGYAAFIALEGNPWWSIGYGFATIVGGGLAAGIGLVTTRRVLDRRRP